MPDGKPVADLSCRAEKGARRSERPPQVQSEVLFGVCRLRSPKLAFQISKTAEGRLSLGGNTDKKKPRFRSGGQGFSGPLMELVSLIRRKSLTAPRFCSPR
jgi:hypothetical protein